MKAQRRHTSENEMSERACMYFDESMTLQDLIDLKRHLATVGFILEFVPVEVEQETTCIDSEPGV